MLFANLTAFLHKTFDFENAAEGIGQKLIYTALAAVAWRLIKKTNDWKPDVRREVLFWVTGIPLMFAIITFASSLASGARNPSSIRGNVRHCKITRFPDYYFVAMDVRLTNPGKPSTAWAWVLRITLLEGQQYEYRAIDPLPRPLDLRQKEYADDPYFMITQENYLPNLLLERTVGADHGAFGWVLFPVNNIPASQVQRQGTKYVIEFEQSDGTKRTIEHIWLTETEPNQK